VPTANAGQVFKRVSAALGPRIKRIPDGEANCSIDLRRALAIFSNQR
jgi:hypothetical protein